jgi:hypothetical protein
VVAEKLPPHKPTPIEAAKEQGYNEGYRARSLEVTRSVEAVDKKRTEDYLERVASLHDAIEHLSRETAAAIRKA